MHHNSPSHQSSLVPVMEHANKLPATKKTSNGEMWQYLLREMNPRPQKVHEEQNQVQATASSSSVSVKKERKKKKEISRL